MGFHKILLLPMEYFCQFLEWVSQLMKILSHRLPKGQYNLDSLHRCAWGLEFMVVSDCVNLMINIKHDNYPLLWEHSLFCVGIIKLTGI